MLNTQGNGPPVVLIPGIQGRWEWMGQAITALSARHRVLTFSLGDADPGDASFDAWLTLIERLLDRAREPRATIVGVSFGGVIAARFAARRPGRTLALVLASAPSPRWRPDDQTAGYMTYPKLAMPLFALRACARFLPEVAAAKPTWPSRARFALRYAGYALRVPLSPTRMANSLERWMATDVAADCGLITAPTLLITGESHLERVVPVESTLDYLTLIPHARRVVFAGTGHVGVITKPREFASLVSDFVIEAGAKAVDRRARRASHAR